jgi:hypothetical protein
MRVMESRRVRWAGHIALMGHEKCIQYFVGKPGQKRPLGRPRRGWKGNIDLREIGWEGVDRIHLAQDRYQWRTPVNTVTNLRFP